MEELDVGPFPHLYEKVLKTAKELRKLGIPARMEKQKEIKEGIRELEPLEFLDLKVVGVDGGHNGEDVGPYYFGIATATAFFSRGISLKGENITCGNVYRFTAPD